MNLTVKGRSLVDIRIPDKRDQPHFESDSLIFSQYERNKHLEHIDRNHRLREVDDTATKNTLMAMKRGTERMQNTIDLGLSHLAGPGRVHKQRSKNRPKAHRQRTGDGLLVGFGRPLDNNNTNGMLKPDIPSLAMEKSETIELTLKNGSSHDHFTLKTSADSNDSPEPRDMFSFKQDMFKRHESVLRVEKDQESDSDDARTPWPVSKSDNDDWSDVDEMEIRIHDPFVQRNFKEELEEVVCKEEDFSFQFKK